MLPHVREALARDGRSSAWGTVLFLLEAPRTLVGMGGYKGEPSDGLVEIGYAIAPAFQGRGLATEAARLLVRRAFADPRVGAVDAHTLPGPSASTRVLEKNGFERIGDMVDEEFGVVWRWRLARAARPPPGE